MSMKIIINDLSKTSIVNKSKFIGIIKKVMTKEEATTFLEKIKSEYSDATHICYAYSISPYQKYSDDNEPEGTAGLPILRVLKMNNLDFTMAIVIRYFGGIKLGTNGLIHAYSGIIKELLKDNIKEIEKGYVIEIEEEYKNSDLLDYILKNDVIIKKEYNNKIKITAIVRKKTLEKLSSISYKIINETII